MKKYRIKIETEKSGRKLYYPQTYSFPTWQNIDVNGYTSHYGYVTFFDIASAEKAIDARIAYLNEKDNEKIIKVEYKYL